MNQKTAESICKQIFDMLRRLGTYPEDYWVSLGNKFDVNFWSQDNTFAWTLYGVKNERTYTDVDLASHKQEGL